MSGQPPAVTTWPPAEQTTQVSPSQPSVASTSGPPVAATAVSTTPAGTGTNVQNFKLPSTGLMGIPASLVKRIVDGNFVDLGELLPEALEQAFDRSTEEKPSEKRKKFPITSVVDWMYAFSSYMAVAVHFDPGKGRPLATYMSIVALLARDVPGQVWQRYDRLFRQAAAANPALAWDRREPDIWLAATVERPRAPLTPASGSRPQGTDPEPEICRRFSRGECILPYCRYRHICGICRSRSHAARECPLVVPRRVLPRGPR